jgi:uncharacterized metal-binding protein
MPNSRTHDIITFVAAPIVGGVTYWLTKDQKTTWIILGFYLFASLMFNGDLDMPSRPFNRWWLLKMFWIPYQLMFHHRSVFTHGLIIGTAIRVAYIAIIPLAILYFKGSLEIIRNIDLHILILSLIGLEAGAAVHTIADFTIS